MKSAIKLHSITLKENSTDLEPLIRPIKVLLVKPYQYTPTVPESPPLGLLCLSASLKKAFGDTVDIKVLDMKLHKEEPEAIISVLKTYDADVIGLSALNCEAAASKKIAALAKKHNPSVITVLGGPYAHKRSKEILSNSSFDWVINGPGDRVFPHAIRRFVNGLSLNTDLAGLSYRKPDGSLHVTDAQDFIEDLDALPIPDWKQIDFDAYSKRMSMMMVQKGKRYALLFTSRGCPYLCNYCHDIFSKKFKFQSPERVIKEIEYLHDTYGVTEFQIVDDIFNLHKPRVKKIMHEVHRRWPGKMHFCFPNGVRADIMDEDVLDDLRLGGTYAMGIAIESAIPRMQDLTEKYLDTEKAHWAIEQADKRGIMVTGFFMVGFPTETPEEIQATINYALTSKLTVVNFFSVIPQPETPIYELALQEDNGVALQEAVLADEMGKIGYYRGDASWYERNYGFPLSDVVSKANRKFYLNPSRIWRILRRIPPRALPKAGFHYIKMETKRFFSHKKHLLGALLRQS